MQGIEDKDVKTSTALTEENIVKDDEKTKKKTKRKRKPIVKSETCTDSSSKSVSNDSDEPLPNLKAKKGRKKSKSDESSTTGEKSESNKALESKEKSPSNSDSASLPDHDEPLKIEEVDIKYELNFDEPFEIPDTSNITSTSNTVENVETKHPIETPKLKKKTANRCTMISNVLHNRVSIVGRAPVPQITNVLSLKKMDTLNESTIEHQKKLKKYRNSVISMRDKLAIRTEPEDGSGSVSDFIHCSKSLLDSISEVRHEITRLMSDVKNDIDIVDDDSDVEIVSEVSETQEPELFAALKKIENSGVTWKCSKAGSQSVIVDSSSLPVPLNKDIIVKKVIKNTNFGFLKR